MSEAVKPPRLCFLDFPLGCPAGRPHEAEQQRAILRTALQLAHAFEDERWEIEDLPFSWSPDGSRAWEDELDGLYRSGGFAIAAKHMAAHKAQGEQLVGNERAFAVRCNC